jgi:uncharacterized surface protein with fasciclin (FAS1) repeats
MVESPRGPGSIVDVALADGSFGKLATMLQAAGLVETLRSAGPFTVLAPTDEAVNASLSAAEWRHLTSQAGRDELRKVLLTHVIPGRLSADQLARAESARTAGGPILWFHGQSDGTAAVNEAGILSADIPAGNGVIHVIDRVIRPRPDLVETARGHEEFSTLLSLIDAAGLTGTLRDEGPFTLIAPTDEAFSAIPAETVTELLRPDNRPALRRILLNHVVPGWRYTFDKVGADSLTTLAGQHLPLLSPSAAHWKVQPAGATLTRVNLVAGNGVIHASDRVLLPREGLLSIAADDGEMNTFVAAVRAAELENLLAGGPFTLLVPSDTAFAALPAGTLEELLRPANRGRLREILTHHAVGGFVLSEEIVGRPEIRSVRTIGGRELPIAVGEAGQVKIGGARVIRTDILGGNGVIHVIDSVLLPPAGAYHALRTK